VLLASCYPSRGYNFEVPTRFLENFLHLIYAAKLLRVHPYCSELVITGFCPYMLNLVSSGLYIMHQCYVQLIVFENMCKVLI